MVKWYLYQAAFFLWVAMRGSGVQIYIIINPILLMLKMRCVLNLWGKMKRLLYLFIFLFAVIAHIPAGEWEDNTNHAEWIRTIAQIPIEQYDKFVDEFNPFKFNADEWVRMALKAGYHPIRVTFFEKGGGNQLKVSYQGPNINKQAISPQILFHKN